jgi:hypothetical protein
MDLKKFKLGDAVEILLDRKRPVFFKTWTLARLLTWMCLDQRRRTRRRNPNSGRLMRSNRQRRDAKFAGHLALAALLDHRWQPGKFDKKDRTLRGLLLLFFTSGGFGLLLQSPRGARGWLPRMKKSIRQVFYVHRVVEYLCRCAKSDVEETKRTIQRAKMFVEKIDKKTKLRTLGKYWETNKQAAPYIFAFYQLCISVLEQSASIDQFIDLLKQLAKNQKRLNQLLGQAAYAWPAPGLVDTRLS